VIVRRLGDCPEFVAGDHTRLRELLHPARTSVRIGYSLAHGTIAPGETSKRHRLASSEVYYFLAGRGTFHISEESSYIEPGTVVSVPPGSVQWVVNSGSETMAFLCLVEPAWKQEDEEVLE
jgi:mannose-6-phosphate isomerase-like protein (cupin superfamily)